MFSIAVMFPISHDLSFYVYLSHQSGGVKSKPWMEYEHHSASEIGAKLSMLEMYAHIVLCIFKSH